ncbi:MAG: sensor histidine kinase [Nitrospirales bacterium]
MIKIHPPLLVVLLMTAAMVLVSGGMVWGWPLWAVVLVGCGLLGAAYGLTYRAWKQVSEQQADIQAGLRQLKRISGSQERLPSPARSGDLNIESVRLNHMVDQIQTRVADLEEERAKIVAVVENLVEGVLAFDPKGEVLFSNPSARRILGLEAKVLQGLTVWEVIRHQELAGLVEACRHLALHETRYAEVELHSPVPMVLEVYALPVPFSNKKQGSVIVLHDVTELRRLEQVRAEFIDNVSHELRTPLTAIVGYLETLLDEQTLDTPNNRKFVQVAHQHAERLSRLVNDLRSLSEIESGNIVVRHEVLQLGSVVEDVCEMFQSQVLKKELQFINHINGTLQVLTDRDRLIQILVNVVDNAIKYTPAGGTISFQVRMGGERVTLQVRDTGQGIPSRDLSRVTERFYRVDRARSREEGGTGLGLSIVKHLTQLLGGKLRILSEVGKGTTVELDLPVSVEKSSS